MDAYLSFKIGGEEFALNVDHVREIFCCREVVRVPQSRPYLRGLISLRGKAIPLMDLGRRIGTSEVGLPGQEIIVAEVPDQGGGWLMGLLVDAVLGLKDSKEEEICPPPQLPRNVGRYVAGIFKESGCYVIDLAKVCAIKEDA